MTPAFETGAPHTGAEHSNALGALLSAGTAYLVTLPEAAFFAPQGNAWSPAGHIRHLRKAGAPLALALKLPRWMIALRFGTSGGPSRSFVEMRDVYRSALDRGAQAGRFAPGPETTLTEPLARRLEIMNAWTAVTVDLQGAIAKWPEAELDRLRLPHPLLGLLTVREMLAFTVYHTAHHLRRVAERAAGEASSRAQ
jgi:hypothetical protein